MEAHNFVEQLRQSVETATTGSIDALGIAIICVSIFLVAGAIKALRS